MVPPGTAIASPALASAQGRSLVVAIAATHRDLAKARSHSSRATADAVSADASAVECGRRCARDHLALLVPSRILEESVGTTTLKTSRLSWLVTASILLLVVGGCRGTEPAGAGAAAAPAQAHMNMLQLMRAFPFPHSNVIFDTQGLDPEGPEKQTSMSFSVYRWQTADTYAGWAGVENSALALAEMAPLLLAPRACSNGRPAPVDRDDWKQAVQGLVDAGEHAYAAALTRNLDEMFETSETLATACAACHDLYRDVDLAGGERCVVASE
jgi:hypothetical protein